MIQINYNITYNRSSYETYTKLIDELNKLPYYQYATCVVKKPDYDLDDIYFYSFIDNNIDTEVGCMLCYKPVNRDILWIQTFIIFEPFNRKKYGTIIVNDMIHHLLDDMNFDTVYLSCYKDNIAGNSFWKHQGFILIANNCIESIKNTDINIYTKTIQGVTHE